MISFLKSELYKGDLTILNNLPIPWKIVRNNILECGYCGKNIFRDSIIYLAQTGSYGWIGMYDELDHTICIYNLVDGKVLSTEVSMEANLTIVSTSIIP